MEVGRMTNAQIAEELGITMEELEYFLDEMEGK